MLDKVPQASSNEVSRQPGAQEPAPANFTLSPQPLKPGATWARVSTHSQAETSLPSQIYRCQEKLTSQGYKVTHVLQSDGGSSTSLLSNPKFKELLDLIANREVEAVCVYDRDRLMCSPEDPGLDRLMFLSQCRRSGVEVLVCEGPPVTDAREGKILELLYSWSKEDQVMRARRGSRQGLHDRVVLYHKPVTYRKIYGYDWDKKNNRLIPNEDYRNLKLIFDMALAGSTYTPILDELKVGGILSPGGQTEWSKETLSRVIHNPTYAGRFYALKSRACEPQRPKKSSRVNSSQKLLPLDQAQYLDNIEIVQPPITWEERQHIEEMLIQHQKLGQRNAKRDYLLRGLIFCGQHVGKQGGARCYHGIPRNRNRTYAYVCPVGGCTRPFIRGPDLEVLVKSYVKILFLGKSDDFCSLINQARRPLEVVRSELQEWKSKYDRKTHEIANSEYRLLTGQVEKEVHELVKAKLTVERKGVERRLGELLEEEKQIGREMQAAKSLEQLVAKFDFSVLNAEPSNDQWRQLFVPLNLRVKIGKGEGDHGMGLQRWTQLRPKTVTYEDKSYYLDPISLIPFIQMDGVSVEVDIPLESPYILKPFGLDKDIMSTEPAPG